MRELLWRTVERIGRLEHFCIEEAGTFGRSVEEARDADEREWLLGAGAQVRPLLPAGARRDRAGNNRVHGRAGDPVQPRLGGALTTWARFAPSSFPNCRSPPRLPDTGWRSRRPTVADSVKITLWPAASEAAYAYERVSPGRKKRRPGVELEAMLERSPSRRRSTSGRGPQPARSSAFRSLTSRSTPPSRQAACNCTCAPSSSAH